MLFVHASWYIVISIGFYQLIICYELIVLGHSFKDMYINFDMDGPLYSVYSRIRLLYSMTLTKYYIRKFFCTNPSSIDISIGFLSNNAQFHAE